MRWWWGNASVTTRSPQGPDRAHVSSWSRGWGWVVDCPCDQSFSEHFQHYKFSNMKLNLMNKTKDSWKMRACKQIGRISEDLNFLCRKHVSSQFYGRKTTVNRQKVRSHKMQPFPWKIPVMEMNCMIKDEEFFFWSTFFLGWTEETSDQNCAHKNYLDLNQNKKFKFE